MKAILLDIDGTLLDFRACARESMILAFADFGEPYEEAMFPVFEAVNGKLWHRVEDGTLTVEELYKIRWNLIFARLGLTHLDGPAFEVNFLAHLERSACPVDGAMELLESLSPRYVLCAASNAPYEQQRRRLESAGMLPHFTHLFISERLGAAKPDPAFFRACLNALSPIRPEEVLMLGDSYNADISGCAAVGIRSCWYCPNGTGDPGAADHIISRLDQISDVLAAL